MVCKTALVESFPLLLAFLGHVRMLCMRLKSAAKLRLSLAKTKLTFRYKLSSCPCSSLAYTLRRVVKANQGCLTCQIDCFYLQQCSICGVMRWL